METVFGIENYCDRNRPIYLALGNFDGVHKGHQRLIEALVEKARAGHGEAVAFIFDPHPAQILMPDRAPRLLNTAARKAQLMAKMGLDRLIYHPFSREIAAWTPVEFVQRILIDCLHVREIFIGFNYSFGHRGLGTPELLEEIGLQMGFGVNIIEPVEFRGEPISSSLVRKALEEGDIDTAYELLGYFPILDGIVVEGEHRGTALGFPTANVAIEPLYHVPGKGVYAARAGVGEKQYHCVVNIGSKPTFHREYPISVEAHLIDFAGDIYRQSICLSFLAKIRDEKRFDSVAELVAQMNRDRDQARTISQSYPENF